MDKWRRRLITWFGCGDVPFASGTWGSAGALLAAGAWFAITHTLLPPGAFWWMWNWGLFTGLIAACILSVAWGPWAVQTFASHHNTRKDGDPGAFVLDEVAGMWLALLWLPMTNWEQALWIAGVQFFVFRVADVIKPWPGRALEKLHGGVGILLDDLSSALYCNLAAQVVFRVLLDWK